MKQYSKDRLKFYKSSQWIRISRIFRQLNPLCVECEKKGIMEPARHVDHIRGWKNRAEFFDITNLQALCLMHHSRKTAHDDYIRKERERKTTMRSFRI